MRLKHLIILALAAMWLTACGSQNPLLGTSPTNTPNIAATITAAAGRIFAEATGTAQAVLSATATVTQTARPTPSASPSTTPTQTPIPTDTPTATVTPLPPNFIPENAILIYMVRIGTDGPIGCGDSLVRLWSGNVRTGDLATDLTIALNSLFRAGRYFGSLYNATYPSTLFVTGVSHDEGQTHVYMDGNYVTPADGCDASRYRSQVWATALQFDEVKHFVPWVRDKLLGDLLSVYKDSGKDK